MRSASTTKAATATNTDIVSTSAMGHHADPSADAASWTALPTTAPSVAATTITPAAAETARHRTRYGRLSPYTTAKAPRAAVAAAGP